MHMSTDTNSGLLRALSERVLVSDGAMGTMLQSVDLSLDDFAGLEGCNEILNVTRPDVVRGVHRAYFEAGADAVESNTFGANFANLAEYDIAERIYELAEAGARLAREVADEFSTPDQPRFVLGSVGPGTKLPTLGHAPYAKLRDAYQEQDARHARRRRRRGHRRDLPGHPAGQVGHARRQARDGRRGHHRADHRPGHRGDHGHHAARHRDRRRPARRSSRWAST